MVYFLYFIGAVVIYLFLVGFEIKVSLGARDSDHKFYIKIGNFRRQIKTLYKAIKGYAKI